MYRRARRPGGTDAMSLDPLLDILTCTVGLMILVVIFAVMEARGARIAMATPMLREAPANLERRVLLCNRGRVRHLDVDNCIERLLGTKEITYDNIPDIVSEANDRNVTDGYFSYRLEYDQWSDWSGWTSHRAIDLVIDEIEGCVGETAEQLGAPSAALRTVLDSFDSKEVWIVMGFDEESLEVFRKARELCIEAGFVTGWDPLIMEFPHKERIVGGGTPSGSRPSPGLSRPQWR